MIVYWLYSTVALLTRNYYFSFNLEKFEFETRDVDWLHKFISLHAGINHPTITTMTDKVETKSNSNLAKVEKELDVLKDELDVHKEAKPVSSSCGDIAEYSQRENEPFSAVHDEPNEWHKSEGGGCVILWDGKTTPALIRIVVGGFEFLEMNRQMNESNPVDAKLIEEYSADLDVLIGSSKLYLCVDGCVLSVKGSNANGKTDGTRSSL